MVDHQLSDFRMARPYATKRHVGFNVADGQAIAGFEVLRILQCHIVQGDVKRRPQPDPGRTAYRQMVTGFALDALGDAGCQETGGDSDHQQQCGANDDGRDDSTENFQNLHVALPDRLCGSTGVRRCSKPLNVTRAGGKDM